MNNINNISNYKEMSLIITTKWKPHIHGWEYEENHLINYMKQKYFVCYQIDHDESSVPEWIEFIENNTNENENIELKIAKSTYTYNNRMFAVINNGIEIFQKKYKNYYKQKMAYCKNPRNLSNREITGRFRYR